MECLAQYLDDLEDLVFAIALKAERIRMAVSFFLFIATAVSLQIFCILIALNHPPVALAIASLLAVRMLFHAVVSDAASAYAN